MNLSIFADQCVPMEAIRRLREAGCRVTPLRDMLHIRAPDPVVIAKAQEMGTILLSLNGDFSDIVAYSPANYRGIISLQLHNHPEVLPRLLDRLTAYMVANPEPDAYQGRLFLVEVHRIRIRS